MPHGIRPVALAHHCDSLRVRIALFHRGIYCGDYRLEQIAHGRAFTERRVRKQHRIATNRQNMKIKLRVIFPRIRTDLRTKIPSSRRRPRPLGANDDGFLIIWGQQQRAMQRLSVHCVKINKARRAKRIMLHRFVQVSGLMSCAIFDVENPNVREMLLVARDVGDGLRCVEPSKLKTSA